MCRIFLKTENCRRVQNFLDVCDTDTCHIKAISI
jgi:hypothetical protein